MAVQGIRVLLVEDNPGDARLLREALAESMTNRFEVTHAETLSRGLALLGAAGFDLVLLDLMLPDSQGLATYSAVYSQYSDTPIVILSSLDDDKLAVEAVQAGAQDYLIKGQVSSSLLGRVLSHAIERHRMQMALRSLSVLDNVAGLYNRIGFFTLARQQVTLAVRGNRPLALILVSLDNRSEIGKAFGFMEEDNALAKTALLLRRSLRPADILGHLGGDVIACMSLGSSTSQVEAWMARFQESVETYNARGNISYRLSISIGVAALDPQTGSSLDLLLDDADQALQAQKPRTKTRGGFSQPGRTG